jgi:hypothetical protein
MKKYNKMFACPCPGGECMFVIAKSKKHLKKILAQCDLLEFDFEYWGKLNNIARDWEVPLKRITQRSGLCYQDTYGRRYYFKRVG